VDPALGDAGDGESLVVFDSQELFWGAFGWNALRGALEAGGPRLQGTHSLRRARMMGNRPWPRTRSQLHASGRGCFARRRQARAPGPPAAPARRTEGPHYYYYYCYQYYYYYYIYSGRKRGERVPPSRRKRRAAISLPRPGPPFSLFFGRGRAEPRSRGRYALYAPPMQDGIWVCGMREMPHARPFHQGLDGLNDFTMLRLFDQAREDRAPIYRPKT